MDEISLQQKPIRFTDSNASVLFDLLRAVAAFLVFFEHGRNLFFLDYGSLVAHRTLLAVPYILSGVGHSAVVVFFVLSGYFISGTVFRSIERGQWLWADYLLRRLVRLWIVLLPALLLCLFWDKLGIHLGHAPMLYAGKVQNHMLPDVSQRLSPALFFGNLFFLQGVLFPVFGSAGPLWSLANEFWYYILFPLSLFSVRRATPWVQRLMYLALLFAVAWFVRGGILNSFPIWLAGTVLVLVPPPRFSTAVARNARILSTGIYLFVFFYLAKISPIGGLSSDYLLTLATFAFLWILLSANGRALPSSAGVRLARDGARFSFTLYAIHTPFLVFIASFLVGDSRWVPSLPHIAVGLGVACLALTFAYLVASFTEFRTDAVRRYVERRLHLPAPPAALPSNPHASTN